MGTEGAQSAEVVDSFRVTNDDQGVNFTKIDVARASETSMFMKNGRYKLVRVDDE